MRYENENIWLSQKMMSTLYNVSVSAISQHLKRVFADNELERLATIKKYLIVQNEGGRQVKREVEHYDLQAIIAVGFKIENERAVQFRKWATRIVKERCQSYYFSIFLSLHNCLSLEFSTSATYFDIFDTQPM